MENPDNFKLEHIYPLIADRLSKDEFSNQIINFRKTTGNLIDDDVLGFFICAKKNKIPVDLAHISTLPSGIEVTVNVKLDTIEPIREFIRKDGSSGKVLTLNVSDPSGKCRIVLWDTNHQESVENNKIQTGTGLLIINSRFKEGMFGFELLPGKHTIMKILTIEDQNHWDWLMARGHRNKDESELNKIQDIRSIIEGGEFFRVNLKGTIKSVGKLREFTRRDGGNGQVINFQIYDGTAEAVLTLWDNFAIENQTLKIGDIVSIKNGRPKIREGIVEIHSDYQTKIEKNE
jgi:ssDNA-binding replication factor A large subunit